MERFEIIINKYSLSVVAVVSEKDARAINYGNSKFVTEQVSNCCGFPFNLKIRHKEGFIFNCSRNLMDKIEKRGMRIEL